jgi:hypothetical protein
MFDNIELEQDSLTELHEKIAKEIEAFAQSKSTSNYRALEILASYYELKNNIIQDFLQKQREADTDAMAAEQAAEEQEKQEYDYFDAMTGEQVEQEVSEQIEPVEEVEETVFVEPEIIAEQDPHEFENEENYDRELMRQEQEAEEDRAGSEL